MPRYEVSTGPVSVAASSTKTYVDLATPAGSVLGVAKWWAEFDATSAGTATSSYRVQLGLFSAAVTTHSPYTPDPFDYGGNGVPSAITAGINATVEGAGTPTHIEEHMIGLTQSGLIVWETVNRVIPASSFFRIRVIAPANTATTNGYFGVAWDE